MQHRNRAVERICMECGTTFFTHFASQSQYYCSLTCDPNEDVIDISTTSEMLFNRESWKYDFLNDRLYNMNIKYAFEYVLGNYIFDLALLDLQVLVEFDGADHNGLQQSVRDLEKDRYAEMQGWHVVRIPVEANSIIDPRSIDHIIHTKEIN